MYIIKLGATPLSSFTPNGLPERTKNGFKYRDIMRFSKRDYYIFETLQEAQDYIMYMLQSVHEEADRYNTVHWCADDIIAYKISKLKIYEARNL